MFSPAFSLSLSTQVNWLPPAKYWNRIPVEEEDIDIIGRREFLHGGHSLAVLVDSKTSNPWRKGQGGRAKIKVTYDRTIFAQRLLHN